jgi:hypothetical protein
METTKLQKPLKIPTTATTCWMAAHEHLVSSYTEWDDFLFITLHSGHQLYGYTSEAGWVTFESGTEVYPEHFTPEYWAEDIAKDAASLSAYPDNRHLADAAKWVEAIRDIPELYTYHEALDYA